jgi:hypothetical protein
MVLSSSSGGGRESDSILDAAELSVGMMVRVAPWCESDYPLQVSRGRQPGTPHASRRRCRRRLLYLSWHAFFKRGALKLVPE